MTSLHDPLTLPCGQVLPNRIMKAALSEALGDKQNSPDERLERLYTSWSRGGYGLIVTGNVMVDRSQLGEPGNVVIEDERNLDALTRWAKATKDAGVPIWVQLNHPGRQSNPLALGHTPVAPSPVPINFPGAATPRELTPDEIDDIIERFANAAVVCETAGFDGVQVHGANGYLVDQFLRDGANFRTDDFGGSIESRLRFMTMVLEAVGAEIGMDKVGIRYSPNVYVQGVEDGDPATLFAAVAKRLEELKVPWIELREPRQATASGAIPTAPVSPAMRRFYSGKIVINSDYDWSDARRRVADGTADAVSIGRLFISNPDLVRRIALGGPLNEGDASTFYSGGANGYTDYPTLDDARAA